MMRARVRTKPGGKRGAARTRREDDALVLRRFPYGESSLVVHLLTRAHGRVTCLAKGAYRLQSGYFGVLDLFDTLRLAWRPRPSAEMALLERGAVLERRRGLTADLGRYERALAVLELAELAARADLADPTLFELVRSTLERLARGAADPDLVLAVYELRYLACLGLAPALATCASCGTAPPAPRAIARGSGRAAPVVPFAVSEGGRLCPACADAARRAGRRVGTLPLASVKIGASLAAAPDSTLAGVRVEPAALAGVRGWIDAFLEYHLDRERTMSPKRTRRRSPRASAAPPPAGRTR